MHPPLGTMNQVHTHTSYFFDIHFNTLPVLPRTPVCSINFLHVTFYNCIITRIYQRSLVLLVPSVTSSVILTLL